MHIYNIQSIIINTIYICININKKQPNRKWANDSNRYSTREDLNDIKCMKSYSILSVIFLKVQVKP